MFHLKPEGSLFEHIVLLAFLCLTEMKLHVRPGISTKFTLCMKVTDLVSLKAHVGAKICLKLLSFAKNFRVSEFLALS